MGNENGVTKSDKEKGGKIQKTRSDMLLDEEEYKVHRLTRVDRSIVKFHINLGGVPW
jgi:hypothetical protein